MTLEINSYHDPKKTQLFEQMVSQDTAKQVIYQEVALQLAAFQILLGHPLRIADIGCGTGHFVEHLQNTLPDAHIFYTDASPLLLESTKQKLTRGNHHGLQINLENGLPFKMESLDCLTAHFVISEITDLDLLLSEFHHVLQPDGICAISMTSPLSDQITTTLRSGKIAAVTNELLQNSDHETLDTTYTLGTAFTVTHIYRDLANIIGAFHAHDFHLTERSMVRFFPFRDGTRMPFPEYLLIYARKDRNKGIIPRFMKRRAYKASIPKDSKGIVTTIIPSTNPEEQFFRMTAK